MTMEVAGLGTEWKAMGVRSKEEVKKSGQQGDFKDSTR